jgi:hypothetical protein
MPGPSPTWTLAVVVAGRGRLPFHDLHGEPLLAHVLRTAHDVARGRPVLVVVDDERTPAATGEPERIARGVGGATEVVSVSDLWARTDLGSLVILDPLCPLAPATFVAEVLGRAEADGESALVAYRPVTDTVKSVVDGRISGTIDRELLGAVSTPVVLPAAVLADPGGPPPVDVTELVGWLRARTRVELVRAPSAARRVDDEAALQVLECVDEINRRSR